MKQIRWLSWVFVLWLLLDFTGLLLSVISTYFYFGWAGTPQLVPKIFLIALTAFSAPLSYRLLFSRGHPESHLAALLPLLVLLYGGLMVVSHSDIFAWGVVLGTWLSGLVLMALLRQVHHFQSAFEWFSAILSGVAFYLCLRVANHGLAVLFSAQPWVIAGLLFAMAGVLAFRLRKVPLSLPIALELKPGFKSLGVTLGLLIGISVGLLYNLHIWSAHDPALAAGVYLLSFGGAALLVPPLWFWVARPTILTGVGVVAVAFALYGVLYGALTPILGVLLHAVGCSGLGLLWLAFCHRYQQRFGAASPLPTLALQLGFLGFLLVLAVFLLQSNPTGFWVALAIVGGVLMLPVAAEEPIQMERPAVLYGALFGAVMLSGLGFLPAPNSIVNTPIASDTVLRVLSSNVRYGWTDDYRFAPLPHLATLQHTIQGSVPADIVGFQEMNKGHTSGAYMDLLAFYQQGLGGIWRYGDANFGFGNALRLDPAYSLVDSQVRRYQAKDILRRSCLWNLVQTPTGQTIEIFVTHLSHLPPPNPVREAQAQELVQWLKQAKHPWILIGDFNARPEWREIQSIVAISHPIFRSQPNLIQPPSFPSLHPQERIDYIFYSRDFQPISGQAQEVIPVQGTSDHNMVAASLILPATQPKGAKP